MEELYYLLDLHGICLQEEQNERDNAIKFLLKLKSKKPNRIEVNDNDILNKYNKEGMEGIKNFFNRQNCYLFATEFVFNILFHHYKAERNLCH